MKKSHGTPASLVAMIPGALLAHTVARGVLTIAFAVLVLVSHPSDARAIAQRVGDFELEIDAPWRMEPRSDPTTAACTTQLGCGPNYVYDAIPIQVSIHDGDQPSDVAGTVLQHLITQKQSGLSWYVILATFLQKVLSQVFAALNDVIEYIIGQEILPEPYRRVTLQRFVSLTIAEKVNGTYVTRAVLDIGGLHEVERTVGVWQWRSNLEGPESTTAPPPRPAHSLCRRWQGESCAGFENVRATSEWHAIAMYQPAGGQVGQDVQLRVDLEMDALYDSEPGSRTFRHYLNVHLGDAPLPRFDGRWAYGDLHYHSQGTDNDGESAYAYRGVLQAMSAMGLDFAFATDHASNSRQIGSAVPVVSTALIQPKFRGLRDMSPDRFAFLLDLLNGPQGANREVASYPRQRSGIGALAAPALFLGAEVDVVPEFDPASSDYSFAQLICAELPDLLKVLQERKVDASVIDALYAAAASAVAAAAEKAGASLDLDEPWLLPFDYFSCEEMTVAASTLPPRRLLRDVQGPDGLDFLSTGFFGRQHLLHLPVDSSRHDAFIASNTSKYGGATRRLGEVLGLELGERQKGYAFLAHPFTRDTGASFGRVGPDLVPYSDSQLRDAFASEYVLGLQLWNENGLRSAPANDITPFEPGSWTKQRSKRRRVLDADVVRWDDMLLWGLNPAFTEPLTHTWLEPDEPRRVFMAGGSDAHGDLNFRRTGFFFGTEGVNDTALGSPRNLVFAGAPEGETLSAPGATGRAFSQQQIVNALQRGNFSVTDGPALRIAVDKNRNGVIDDDDVHMGEVARPSSPCAFDVVVEWKSTPEFAGVEQIDLYLGVFADELPEGMVYQTWHPWWIEALGRDARPEDVGDGPFIDESTGKQYVRGPNYPEPYWYDPTETTLRITPRSSERFEGQRTVRIRPDDFPVGEGSCLRATARNDTDFGGGFGSGGSTLEPCDRLVFMNKTRPDRLYLRAEVRNEAVPGSDLNCVEATYPGSTQTECIYRQAYSNPVWVSLASARSGRCPTAFEPVGAFPPFLLFRALVEDAQ